jgi:hypothetical protein
MCKRMNASTPCISKSTDQPLQIHASSSLARAIFAAMSRPLAHRATQCPQSVHADADADEGISP